MTRRPWLLLAASLALVLASLGAVPSYAGGSAAKRAVQQSKRIVVQWQGYQRNPVYQRTANVPGIGAVDLVCRPNSTMIRLRTANRRSENQMWLAKFETKNGTDRVAVKNVRVYTYATAADNGRGGTGPQAHEGLNQRWPIEDFEKGTAYGVISSRPGRNRPGGGTMTVPATAFRLTWYWERFAYPGSQYCKMTLALRTDTTQQFGLSWHGDAEAATKDFTTVDLGSIGQAQLRCETGRTGDQTVALKTDDPNAYMDYEYIRGEGLASDRVDHYSDLDRDPVTGLLGPVDLPTNGMMRIWWSVNGVKRMWVLSSYMVVNNAKHPELNVCEVAAARLP
ncbi:hypothetical protein [Nocardioides sp.]|uniref:hypothetical protein n=1 Tax=Nocardioides sp. TaxID=35761 RepID=UPI00378328ED